MENAHADRTMEGKKTQGASQLNQVLQFHLVTCASNGESRGLNGRESSSYPDSFGLGLRDLQPNALNVVR
jgi:hypothetical protein